MTNETKVVVEVRNIIKSDLKISEKEKALNSVKTDGRPGCDTAREMMRVWRKELWSKRFCLQNNLHSQDVEGRAVVHSFNPAACTRTGMSKIIDYAFDHGYGQWARTVLGAEKDFVLDWCMKNLQLSKHDYVVDALNCGMAFYIQGKECHTLKQAYTAAIYSGCFDFKGNPDNAFRRLHKALGKFYAQFFREYYADVLPACKKLDEELSMRMEENEEWQRNLGFVKYMETLSGTPNYITSPLSAGKGNKVVMFPYAFEAYEDVEEDWDYYSKAWHRAHGPKRTVESREVRVYKWGKGLINAIELPKWKPGFMTEVVAQVLGLKQSKVEKSLRRFQVSPWVDVKRSVKRDGIQFYNLTMGKYTVGVVAYDEQRDIHYHADTKEDAIAGLKDKLAKIEQERQRVAMESKNVITADMAHSRWGFCWPGMTEFAQAIGFDLGGAYTVAQLREAVKSLHDRSIVRKYRRELEIAKIINYETT